MSNTGDRAQRQGPPSPALPAPPKWEAERPHRPVTTLSPARPRTYAPDVAPPLPTSPPRKRPITLMDFWPTTRPFKAGRPANGASPDDLPPPRGGRRRTRDQPEANRPPKLAHPTPTSPRNALGPRRARLPHPDSPSPPTPPAHVPTVLHTSSPPPSPAEVLLVGPTGPPALQAISPSGDVRLTLRRYAMGDSLASPHLLLRLDLRIHPRDLYSIPSDGHCGFHTLAVLTHPHYPAPPSPADRALLHHQLLLRLQELPVPDIRAAAAAGLSHPPPRLLPRSHWFSADWLSSITDLPPIGCLALHTESDSPLSPWYYCTALSGAPSQLEHPLRLKDDD